MEDLAIIGAGGHGREVAWVVSELNDLRGCPYNFLGFVDDHATSTVEAYPVLGTIEWLKQQRPRPHVIVAIGSPAVRRGITTDLEAAGFPFATIIAASARMSPHVHIGAGTYIGPQCLLTTNIRVGQHALLNWGTSIGHDTALGDYASIMPGVMIAGNVQIGTGVFIGIGATVINGVSVGEWSVVGAGATVTDDIPPHVLAVGVPAKPIRQVVAHER